MQAEARLELHFEFISGTGLDFGGTAGPLPKGEGYV